MFKEYKNYYKRKFSYKLLLFFVFPFVFIIKFLPRKKGLKLYGSMYGYAIVDNSRYKFINEYDEFSYFITKNKSLLNKPIFRNVYPVYSTSLLGIYLQIRAEKIYYTHAIFDFNPILICGAKIIALWHGCPVKSIGPKSDWQKYSIYGYIFRIYFYRIFSYMYYMHCDEIICPFKSLKNEYKEHFLVSQPKILIENQPRNKYIKKNNLINNSILFVPTYRNYINFSELCNLLGLFTDEVLKTIKDNDIKLTIRPHPIDLDMSKKIKLPDYISIDTSIDLYNTITKYEYIVTDFSSIYYDCIEIGKKVFLLINDFEIYIKSNGLNKSFIKIAKNNSYTSFSELIKNIISN